LNTLKWAKKQGALVGPAHSGWGIAVKGNDLPSYEVPAYDGIGANEYIVDVTHEVEGPDGELVPAVDFLSMCDTPHVWELNMWYHALNNGFRTRVSGETDFPCIYGERVGLGRSYVKLDGKLDYEAWCEAIRVGRNYVGDGRSHLMEFQVNDVRMGEKGSELKLNEPGTVKVVCQAAAYLPEQPNTWIMDQPQDNKPYWHIERARMVNKTGKPTRNVPVELIVNGYPVQSKVIAADGKINNLTFDVPIEHSSWVALRIRASSHTNPIFVVVDDKPIRASKRSAEWALKGVDQCWSQKKRFIKQDEMKDAEAAYAHARTVYQNIIKESVSD
jgi:hypothetical protein